MVEHDDRITAPTLEKVPHAFYKGTPEASRPDLSALGSPPLARVTQVHSARAITVSAPFPPEQQPEADALVTATPGLALGIVTADCAPVLLHDPSASVVGAVHAGWRGALDGVLEAAIQAMVALGGDPSCMVAVVGPCIQQASYEVDDAFRGRFNSDADSCFAEGRAGYHRFDLPLYVSKRLRCSGVGSVGTLALDTYAREDAFHSYRRATHRGRPTGGRQLSVIALPT